MRCTETWWRGWRSWSAGFVGCFFWGRWQEGFLAHDFEAVGFQSDGAHGVAGEEADFFDAEVAEDLRAQAVFAQGSFLVAAGTGGGCVAQ